jgi:hypothetical protein
MAAALRDQDSVLSAAAILVTVCCGRNGCACAASAGRGPGFQLRGWWAQAHRPACRACRGVP